MPQGSNLHQNKAYNNTNSAVYGTQFTYFCPLIPIFAEPVTIMCNLVILSLLRTTQGNSTQSQPQNVRRKNHTFLESPRTS